MRESKDTNQSADGGRPRLSSRLRWGGLDSAPVAALGIAAALAVAAVAVGDLPIAGGASQRPPARTASPEPSVMLPDDQAITAYMDPEHLASVPVGPEPVAKGVKMVLTNSKVIDALGVSGLPRVAQSAYTRAEARLARTDPGCRLRWTLLAAIGRVESNHGRFGGARLRADGYGTRRIRGIPLDGRPNVALIRDTDGGALDGDTTYDRAVGPMQFIPGTWRSVGADGNGDGRADPNNIFDAALGAGLYLCAGDGDLRDPGDAARAVRRYNNADQYVQLVLRLAAQYERSEVDVVAAPAEPSAPVPETEPQPPSASRPTATSSPVPTRTATRAPTRTRPPAATGGPTARPSPSAPRPAPPTDLASPTVPGTPTPQPTATPTKPRATATQAADTAAVGWAPAMREVVVSILKPCEAAKSTPTGSASASSVPPTRCPPVRSATATVSGSPDPS